LFRKVSTDLEQRSDTRLVESKRRDWWKFHGFLRVLIHPQFTSISRNIGEDGCQGGYVITIADDYGTLRRLDLGEQKGAQKQKSGRHSRDTRKFRASTNFLLNV
jgi:hypothetical protein